ncbi:MAG: YraN family protein [Minwuia sp.]|nr:YraN family protein [Minwuia sp.]
MMAHRSGDARRRAVVSGRHAETIAACMLRLKGYRIVGRNMRTPVGEVDIVARRGNLVAFVEVKRRNDRDAARRAVSRDQQRRISRAAEYLRASKRLGGQVEGYRFDLIAVSPRGWPTHMPDMWRP